MEKSTICLIFSLIALILSIIYFLSFHAFRKSRIIQYDNNKLLLNSNRTYICDNVQDLSTCKKLIIQSKMINANDNNIYLNKNTMLCDDVNDKDSCECLSKNCNLITKRPNYMFIDKPTSFSDSKTGLYFSGRLIPKITNHQFSFLSWINITKTDVDEARAIFQWGTNTDEKKKQPAIYITPKKWYTCDSKIDIRFSNLNEENEGIFNLIENNHGHCVRDTIHYRWFHFALVADKDKLFYYINGNLVQTENLDNLIEVGGDNQWVYIGGGLDYSCKGILLAKTRWFADALTDKDIKFYYQEKPNS